MEHTAAIELWLVDLEACADALEALERKTPRLSDDDRGRAQAISDPRERRHRVAAYTALRILLERMAGPHVRGRAFPRAPGGKPGLPESGAEYSLSHTQGLALIAVTRALPVGVDLERIRPVRMSARACDDICAVGAGLGGRLALDPGTDRTFLQSWTRLEAFSKARGRGLARTLADVGMRERGGRRRLTPEQLKAAARRLALDCGLSVRDLGLPRGLLGAIAAPRGAPRTRPRTFPATQAEIERLLVPGPAAG